MRDKVKAFVRRYGMIDPGMKIVAGISGGADSVCLLFLLREICREEGADLLAVHVNHCLRGAESDGDEAFVRDLCAKWGIPFKVYRFDVGERARGENLTTEEAGRLCRYEAFRTEAGVAENGLAEAGVTEDGVPGNGIREARIAVAHHRDDQAETVLFNLLRGSGIRGLGGMRPVKDGIIRPLLCVGRGEILEFLDAEGLDYRTDSSNNDLEYSRNRIRNGIMKSACEDINPRATEHIAEAAEELAGIEKFLEKETRKAMTLCVRGDEDSFFIFSRGFEGLDPVIRARVLRECMRGTGGLKDVTREHIRRLGELFDRQTGTQIDLPCGRGARREYDGVRLWGKDALTVRECPGDEGRREPDVVISAFPTEAEISGHTWTFTVTEWRPDKIIPEKRYTKFFDCDRILQNLTVRRRRPGDFLEINAEHGRKTLKKYFTDEKIPADEREKTWLLADGSHILWIPGHRISEGYKIGPATRRALVVRIDGGEC